MGRKRCFESLEERRLLADVGDALAAPPPASSLVGAPSASPVTAASSPTPGAASATTSADAPVSAESPDEYASSASSAAGDSKSASNYAASNYAASSYAGANAYGSYANDYSSSRLHSNGANNSTLHLTPAQSAALESLAVALDGQARVGPANSPGLPFGPVALAPFGSASAGGIAGGGGVASKPSDLVVRSEAQPPLAVARPAPAVAQPSEELANPIALLSPGSLEVSAFSEAQTGVAGVEGEPRADGELTAPSFAGPLSGSIAASLEHVERGVDALFERLERWGAEWTSGSGPRRFGQVFVAAAGAAAAWEYARARYRETVAGRRPYDWRAPRELQLSRRRVARRRGTP